MISVGLVGAGGFSATFAAQLRRVPGISLSLICHTHRTRARDALAVAGYQAERIADCQSGSEIMDSMARQQVAVLQDWQLLADLPLNVVVETTGSPNTAAAIAELSAPSGYHVAMVTRLARRFRSMTSCPPRTGH